MAQPVGSSMLSAIASVTSKGSRGEADRDDSAYIPGGKSLYDVHCMDFEFAEKTVVDRMPFCALMSVVTIANMLVLGIEADSKCRHNCTAADDGLWLVFDHFFTVFFAFDVVVTIFSLGPKKYFLGEGKRAISLDLFHIIDLILVVLRIVDVWILTPIGISSDLKLFSALRVMHLGRFAKQVQLIDGFRELWLILAGMADTLRTVFWVAVLLLLVLWVFAVSVTLIVNDSTVQYNFSQSLWTKEDYWGTVFGSLWSLFQVLTRDRWSGALVWPLVEANTPLVFIFALFIVVASMALLNTIVGAVVESTLRSSRDSEEKQTKQKQRQDAQTIACMEKIFREADGDGSGDLDEEELRAMMENPTVKKALHQLGIPIRDLEILFASMDEDGGQKIRTDVFFRGCTRLRGPAMARDLQHASVDLNRHCMSASHHINAIKLVNDSLSDILDIVDKIESEIVKDPEQDEHDPVVQFRRGGAKKTRSSFLRTTKYVDIGDMSKGPTSNKSKPPPAPETLPRVRTVATRFDQTLGSESDDVGGAGKACGMPLRPPPPPLPPHLRGLL